MIASIPRLQSALRNLVYCTKRTMTFFAVHYPHLLSVNLFSVLKWTPSCFCIDTNQ
jgi:hypothetical protein